MAHSWGVDYKYIETTVLIFHFQFVLYTVFGQNNGDTLKSQTDIFLCGVGATVRNNRLHSTMYGLLQIFNCLKANFVHSSDKITFSFCSDDGERY